MKAYYYDDIEGDPRLPHDSTESVSPDTLSSLGLLHYTFPPPPASAVPTSASPDSLKSSSLPTNPDVDTLAAKRSYKNRDVITVSPQAMGDIYEFKITSFFAEHMHEDEEIRYILDGAGYFDVRAKGDERWVRVRLETGDLLVLPAGIYHRFTVDEGNYIKAMRLFRDEPKWTPLNRGSETEGNEFRREYVKARDEGFQSEGVTV